MPQGMYWAYPSPPANIQTGDISIQTSIERDTHKYSYRDDLRSWQGFMFTIQKIGNIEYVCIPVEFGINNNIINKFTYQELRLASGNLLLQRPANKKAYLHGISYSVYDYHQIVPRLLPVEQCPNYSQYTDAYYPQINETIYSAIVGIKGYPSQEEDFLYLGNLSNGIKYATYDMASPFRLNPAKYRDAHFISEHNYSNKTAPRSNVMYGMLPMDYYHNHFDISLMGLNNLGQEVKWLWNNKGFVYPNSNVITNHSFGILHEEIIPQIFNEINLLIDDNITNIKVNINRPYLWIPVQINETYDPRTNFLSTHPSQTIFKLPVKVELSILYY